MICEGGLVSAAAMTSLLCRVYVVEPARQVTRLLIRFEGCCQLPRAPRRTCPRTTLAIAWSIVQKESSLAAGRPRPLTLPKGDQQKCESDFICRNSVNLP